MITYEDAKKDAIDYENMNDDYLEDLINNSEDSTDLFEYTNESNTVTNIVTSRNKKICSIPIKYLIEDETCEHVVNLRKIMNIDGGRSPEEKAEFKESLILAINEKSISYLDKNNSEQKIELKDLIINEFRCFKYNTDEDGYRFKGYYDHVEMGLNYNNGTLKNRGDAGVYACSKKHKSKDGHINNPNTFYISYAY